MEKVLGSEILTRIAFLNDMFEINEYLTKMVDADKIKLFNNVVSAMESQFHDKYFSKRDDFVGFNSALKKAENNNNIDYSEVFDMIEDYYDVIENDLLC